MRTRWGSCSRAGRILLNPNLVEVAPSCIEYVIAHVLCHLVEMNHTPRFWRLLASVLPDWADRRRRLAAEPVWRQVA